MAAARGIHETDMLKENIDDQLNRLLTQLEDLEELKDEFEAGEYEETKAETVAQLREFQTFLDKTLSGDMTLETEFGAAQMAIQAAISQAFKTPEVIRLFAKKQPDQLRKRLADAEMQVKLKNLSREAFNQQAFEILGALKSMGEKLTEQEAKFLAKMQSTAGMEAVSDGELGSGAQANLMHAASSQINRAKN